MNGSLDLHPKVAGASLSGALALIALWALSYWVVVPVEVGAAFTVVIGFAGGWLAPAASAAQASVTAAVAAPKK